MAVNGERLEAAARNSAERRGSKRTRETPQGRSSAELGKAASGSATQGLWLGDRKVESQVIGEDQIRLPGRRTVGEVRRRGRRGRRASDRAKERVYKFRVRCG